MSSGNGKTLLKTAANRRARFLRAYMEAFPEDAMCSKLDFNNLPAWRNQTAKRRKVNSAGVSSRVHANDEPGLCEGCCMTRPSENNALQVHQENVGDGSNGNEEEAREVIEDEEEHEQSGGDEEEVHVEVAEPDGDDNNEEDNDEQNDGEHVQSDGDEEQVHDEVAEPDGDENKEEDDDEENDEEHVQSDGDEEQVHDEVAEPDGDDNNEEDNDEENDEEHVQLHGDEEQVHDEVAESDGVENKEKDDDEENDDDDMNVSTLYSDDNDDDRNTFSVERMKKDPTELIFVRRTTNFDVVLTVIAESVRSNSTFVSLVRCLRREANRFISSQIPRTIKGLWKLLSRNDNAVFKRHYICEICRTFMGSGAGHLIDCKCGKYVGNEEATQIPYFINVRLAPQIRQLLATPTMYEALQYSRTREKSNEANMEDMFDGREYKRMTSGATNFLSNVDNLSVTFNTDGCSVTNSSRTSAWPILLQVNELPPHLRKRYILLGGIYVGTHPNLFDITLPTIRELQELYERGVVWKHPGSGVERTTRVVTAVCSVDTPARSDILNMTRFNGFFGCTICLHPGFQRRSMKRGPLVYPVKKDVQLRTHEQLLQNMTDAAQTQQRVKGAIGISVLSILPSFDMATGVIVESMHNAYLGIAKPHTELLFTGKATDPWYSGSPRTFKAVNDNLMRIRRPSKIARCTRSMDDMKNWKANEWRNWLLYYAIVCMKGNVDNRHVVHVAKLSSAVYMLNKDSISTDELAEARRLINEYVADYEKIFGIDKMRYNVHLLTHLPDTVENWGPMWAHSAFPFETWNKKIIDSVTSANSRPLQIATRHMMYTFMESALYEESVSDETKEEIISTLYGGGKKGRKVGRVGNANAMKFQGNGKVYKREPEEWESQALQASGFENIQSVTGYRNATIRGINYESHEPGKGQTKRYCDEYIHCAFGFCRIISIVECTNETANKIVHGFFVALVKSLGTIYETHHIHRVEVVPADRRFVCVDDRPPKPAVLIRSTNNDEFAVALSNVWESD